MSWRLKASESRSDAPVFLTEPDGTADHDRGCLETSGLQDRGPLAPGFLAEPEGTNGP